MNSDCHELIILNIQNIFKNKDITSIELRKTISSFFTPSILEKNVNGEIATSIKLVDEMLDCLGTDFWKTPKPVLEPCCGKGNFVLGIFDRFYDGLEYIYPNKVERCRIIMTECIFFTDLSEINVFITVQIMKYKILQLCGILPLYKFNKNIGDSLILDVSHIWGINLNLFNVIGNPPYSTNSTDQSPIPLYNKFIAKFIEANKLLFVTASRWFVGGKGLDNFRVFMLKRTDIVFIRHEPNYKSKGWFESDVNIEGGVSYFLKDTDYNGECLFNDLPYNLSKYDCIINPIHHNLIDIVKNKKSIDSIYCSTSYYGYSTNDARCKKTGIVKCYVSLQKSKDRIMFVDEPIKEADIFWKVITARANGKSPRFGASFIGKPDEVYTSSYISFKVNSELEAKSLLSYLKTDIVNHLLSIRKISQDISKKTCLWIPLVPFDRLWSNDSVCEYLQILELSIY